MMVLIIVRPDEGSPVPRAALETAGQSGVLGGLSVSGAGREQSCCDLDLTISRCSRESLVPLELRLSLGLLAPTLTSVWLV